MPVHICRHPGGLELGRLNILRPWPENQDQGDAIAFMSVGLEAGISVHGERYLIQHQSNPSIASVALELLFEQVRQRFYSDRPSRLQSFFALKDESCIVGFNLPSDFPVKRVYEVREVEEGSSFTANMNLLKIDDPGGLSLVNAHHYWQGIQGRFAPAWEILIPRAIYVVKELSPVIDLPTNFQVPESLPA